jgi:hypothetical protein
VAQDLLPRSFQGDVGRFYSRVIQITLAELPIHTDVRGGEFTSMDEFLDNAAKQTSNLLAYETRRAFALTLAAVFERQLRLSSRRIRIFGGPPIRGAAISKEDKTSFVFSMLRVANDRD